ncbi:MAG: sensory rhodopsin transducer [Bacillota bacterium]|nr:sensory rhodopsin transducer [Bacillota bacterium]
MEIGKRNWVFCDGYLPPHGDDPAFQGHEALMMTNLNEEKAEIELTFIFEDREPESGIKLTLEGMRTTSLRLDKPLGEQGLMLGESVQYTVWVKSSVPICACFGRLDVRQANMAYYSVEGYAF